jgi:transposase
VIPPRDQRDRRDLTRDRPTLGQARTRELNRGPGGLERATSTLASVATDLLGGSRRAILAAWLEGRADPATMAEVAQGRWRRTRPVWAQALTGRGRDHHRRVLARPVAPMDVLEAHLEAWSTALRRRLPDLRAAPTPRSPVAPAGAGAAGRASAWTGPDSSLTAARAVTGLDPSPGVEQRGGARWGAEGGLDMARVGTAARRAAWSGVAPGNDASAGTQRSGTPRQGHRALRTGLTPLAQAAARTQGTSVAAWSPRLAARRGQKRALRAVAHSIVVSAFSRLSRHEPDHA